MMTATYTTFAGMVVHQRKNGVDTELISDPLGSVVKTKDASGNETSRTEYWPYGEVQSSTGSNPTPFGFVGTLGYYRDLATRLYVRARYLRPDQGRWQTVDPLWPDESAYGYVRNMPLLWTDGTGLGPQQCFAACMKTVGYPNPGYNYQSQCFTCNMRCGSHIFCGNEGCFIIPSPPGGSTKPPGIDPKPIEECIKKCAGYSGSQLSDCLKKCGADKIKGIALDKLFCLIYPGYCEQYGNTPCNNVHDNDSCQACADQQFLQCMISSPPSAWLKCENNHRGDYTKCLLKYSR